MNYLQHRSTGNIVTPISKKILHYSYEDFIASIVGKKCCFICGAEAGSKNFNDEHVIPNWILKHFCGPKEFTILPNNAKVFYSQYKVPCCEECNTELGKNVELFVSGFLRRSYHDIADDLHRDARLYLKLYQWMCLLFFKTHYKDCFLRSERDLRMDSGSIADTYCWHNLYHVHSIARKHYTHAQVSDNVYGTIIVLEALDEGDDDNFDYLDNLNSPVMMIRVGRIVLFAVLNDSRFCLAAYRKFFRKITGPLTMVQQREIFARLRYANENIKERPRYYTAIDRKKGYRIKASIPRKIEFFKDGEARQSLSILLRFYLEDIMPPTLPNRKELLTDIQNGYAQFIFDENDMFYQHPKGGSRMKSEEN